MSLYDVKVNGIKYKVSIVNTSEIGKRESLIKMFVRETWEFIQDSLSFMIFSFLLIFPADWIISVANVPYLEHAEAIFSESLAPRTIMVLFISSVMITSLVLLFTGSEDTEHDGKIKKYLFKHLINRQIKFGVSFCSASFGMLIGLSLALLLLNYIDISKDIFLSSLLMFGYALFFKTIEYLAINGFDDTLNVIGQKILLIIIFFLAPFLLWLTSIPIG